MFTCLLRCENFSWKVTLFSRFPLRIWNSYLPGIFIIIICDGAFSMGFFVVVARSLFFFCHVISFHQVFKASISCYFSNNIKVHCTRDSQELSSEWRTPLCTYALMTYMKVVSIYVINITSGSVKNTMKYHYRVLICRQYKFRQLHLKHGGTSLYQIRSSCLIFISNIGTYLFWKENRR